MWNNQPIKQPINATDSLIGDVFDSWNKERNHVKYNTEAVIYIQGKKTKITQGYAPEDTRRQH